MHTTEEHTGSTNDFTTSLLAPAPFEGQRGGTAAGAPARVVVVVVIPQEGRVVFALPFGGFDSFEKGDSRGVSAIVPLRQSSVEGRRA